MNKNQVIETHLENIHKTLARFSNCKTLKQLYFEIPFVSKKRGKYISISRKFHFFQGYKFQPNSNLYTFMKEDLNILNDSSDIRSQILTQVALTST